MVKQYGHSLDGALHPFFLPPYSPELDPDELVWNHVKRHSLGRKLVIRRRVGSHV
jgi:transposase